MSMPPRLEWEQALADVRKQIANNHKGIRKSLARLRTLVMGYYDEARRGAQKTEARVQTIEIELEHVRSRMSAVERKTGVRQPSPPVSGDGAQ